MAVGQTVGGTMADSKSRLTTRAVQTAKHGMHADGGGLYLLVSSAATRSWIYRYQVEGRRREMGLGAFPAVSLAEARGRALSLRKALRIDGIDPLRLKREAAAAKAREQAEAQARAVSFMDVGAEYIATHARSWRNAKHASQWTSTLTTYAAPVFGAVPVAEIDRELVLKVLSPVWATKTETATRVRSRIDWC